MKTTFKNKKLLLGLIYGLTAGFAFASFAWGLDAWFLAQANAPYFWFKIILGMLVSLIASGIVGWLTIRFENHWFAFLLWGSLAILFSWLVVWLPITGIPIMLTALNPDLVNWINYSEVENLSHFRLVSLFIIGLVAVICGLLEINLVEQALLSRYSSAAVMAMLVCLILFSLAGNASDYLMNHPFREPVQVIDDLIQFAADHQGEEVPPAVARRLHYSAVSHLDGILQKSRQVTLIAYDQVLGRMDVLVDFEGTLVNCTTIYAQPTNCVRLDNAR